VRWTQPGGHGTRTLPACAQDAARVEAGENPKVREIKIGKLTGSYWDAGAAYLPYSEHYFQSGVIETYNRPMEQGPLGG